MTAALPDEQLLDDATAIIASVEGALVMMADSLKREPAAYAAHAARYALELAHAKVSAFHEAFLHSRPRT